MYKNQISKLIITVATNKNKTSIIDLSYMYIQIFIVFNNLQCLNFCASSDIYIHYLTFHNKPSNIFCSTLTDLHVNLESFEDCLYLLDGRFNQLRKFYVNINCIDRSFIVINNKVS